MLGIEAIVREMNEVYGVRLKLMRVNNLIGDRIDINIEDINFSEHSTIRTR